MRLIPHARPRGVAAGACERLLDGWGQQPRPAAGTPSASDPTIKIGSDGFYEAKLMAEIYAQALEANGLHGRSDRHRRSAPARCPRPALESGQIDLKPEYIGSGLAYYEPGKQTGDPTANATELQTVLNGKGGGITVLNYSPAADQNAFVVRPDTAAQFNLTKMSDLTAVQDQLKFGRGHRLPDQPGVRAPRSSRPTAST